MNRYSSTLLLLLGATLLGGCQQSGLAGPSASPDRSPTTAAPSPAKTPAAPARKGEPTFSISTEGENLTLTRTQLLAHPALQSLTITDKAAYQGKTLTFQAVPINALFEGLPVDDKKDIEFDSLDGFSASLDPKLLLNTDPKGSIAYLAVEDPAQPWPKLGNGGTAGPLYLVWKNPELSKVGQEQWPFQLRSFIIKPPVEERFPALLPAADLAPDNPARLGYEVFVKNCFACHTLNGEGSGRLGPDLNEPYSPTEYLHEEYLRKLVRDPQSLRHWKGSKMSAFSEASLPDRDLDRLIAYLKHKAEQRRAGAPRL